jgi:catechol 2,3-dioxygenase
MQAKFFATGGYHHHIGSNIWMGRNISAMAENDLGLAYYSFYVNKEDELSQLANHWENLGVSFVKDGDESLWIVDPNGIQIKFEQEPKTN